MMKVTQYCSRWGFILKRCNGRRVLHLGCIGETDVSTREKLSAFAAGRVLHPHLMAAAREVVGVDLDGAAVELIRSNLGVQNILLADVEKLETVVLDGTFDVVLCGNLLEHLSCPGRALEGVRRFMAPESELIVSVPNSFALLANLRFTLGRFRDGAQHVATFSKFNLMTLLGRHGFSLTELYTCYDRPPSSRKQQIQFALGTPILRLLAERGGTLLAVAKKES
jgi:2-polyprenyl-3-methyl-5-hydroxy-6-metoxy-1,4-benzoquinol methylase